MRFLGYGHIVTAILSLQVVLSVAEIQINDVNKVPVTRSRRTAPVDVPLFLDTEMRFDEGLKKYSISATLITPKLEFPGLDQAEIDRLAPLGVKPTDKKDGLLIPISVEFEAKDVSWTEISDYTFIGETEEYYLGSNLRNRAQYSGKWQVNFQCLTTYVTRGVGLLAMEIKVVDARDYKRSYSSSTEELHYNPAAGAYELDRINLYPDRPLTDDDFYDAGFDDN